jgi:hypothetical protein
MGQRCQLRPELLRGDVLNLGWHGIKYRRGTSYQRRS